MTTPVPPRPDRRPPGPIDATWNPLEAIPVFVLAILVAGILSVPIQILGACSVRFIGSTLVGELAFGAAVLFWVRYVNHAPLAALGRPERPLGDAVAGIATGAGLVVLGYVVLEVVRIIATRALGHAPVEPQQVDACVRGGALYGIGPVVVLAAPFGEELLFRGFIYKGLRRWMPVWSAAVISGIAFGLVHLLGGLGVIVLIPALVVVGIGLALIYERRQSLLASMAAHATFNLVGIISIALSRH
jgi:uncharacterized protein